jgi:hypothetical protein
MIPLSWSALRDAQCPFRFDALRISKTYKEPQGEAAQINSHVAEILATYRQYCFDAVKPSDMGYLLKISQDKTADAGKTEKILELVERFINTPLLEIPLDASWVRIESKLAFDQHLNPLPEKDGWFSKDVAFRMVSDFAYIHDRTLMIIDDKTGRADTDKRQVDYYAHLLQSVARNKGELGGYDRICCIINELGKGRVEVVAEYEPGPVEGVREEIMEHLARVNAWTKFPAIACSQCKWCSVPACPLRTDSETALVVAGGSPIATIPTELTTREEAERAMMFVMFAERVTDQVKELLRTWVQQHGPVVAGGKVAEERENKPWKVTDLERLAKTILAFGVPIESLWKEMSLSESALEKLVKKSKLQAKLPILLSMGERKEYKPKFGLYNDKL